MTSGGTNVDPIPTHRKPVKSVDAQSGCDVKAFKNVGGARISETPSTDNDELRREFMSLIDGELTFFDLPTPDFD